MLTAVRATFAVVLLLLVPAAASQAATDSVIVKYKAAASAASRSAAATLTRSAAVEYAEPNVELHALAIPNDAQFSQLYGLNNTGQTGGLADADIDAPEGWDAGGLGSFPATGGVKVGIVDTGIDANHEDLSGKLVDCGRASTLFGTVSNGNCADDNDHGTHVSGTIAAKANNGVGVAGVAFNSPLSMCKALNALGSGSTAGVANCITWLIQRGSKIISMSLGGGASSTMQTAVRNASNAGALIIAATDNRDARASFSNANSDVEIAAPGVNILSTKRGGGYVSFSGTSMATPHVAGVAALIWGKNPGFTAAQARSKLDASVDDKGPAGRDPSFGFGRVNLQKALTP